MIFTYTGGIVVTTALITATVLFLAYLIFGTIHDEQKKRYEAELQRRNKLRQRNKAAHQQVTATTPMQKSNDRLVLSFIENNDDMPVFLLETEHERKERLI